SRMASADADSAVPMTTASPSNDPPSTVAARRARARARARSPGRAADAEPLLTGRSPDRDRDRTFRRSARPRRARPAGRSTAERLTDPTNAPACTAERLAGAPAGRAGPSADAASAAARATNAAGANPTNAAEAAGLFDRWHRFTADDPRRGARRDRLAATEAA